MSPRFKHTYECIAVKPHEEPHLEWDLIAAGDTLQELLDSATYVAVDYRGNIHAAEDANDALAIEILTNLFEVYES